MIPCVLQQRQNLQVQLAALQADYDNLNARYEEESENASMYRQMVSAMNYAMLILLFYERIKYHYG